MNTTRRGFLALSTTASAAAILAPAAVSSAPPVPLPVHNPETLIFEDWIGQAFDFKGEEGHALGVMLRAADGTAARQAVILRKGATAAETGRALEQLGKFLQAPDGRLRVDCDILIGHELNHADHKDAFPADW